MQTVTKPARLEQNLGWITLLLLLIGCLLVKGSSMTRIIPSALSDAAQVRRLRNNLSNR